MKYTEVAAQFACEGDTLQGIVALPEVPLQTGVVVVVGGPQYRVGSHRQFVLLSRTLASAGYPVLRFDYRGMGDSEGEPRSFLEIQADIAAAIGALQSRVPAVERVALWGLCDGASAALLYCHATRDPRVSALCLLNPWVRSEAGYARIQMKHYSLQRLGQKEFWRKLLRGGVGWQAVTGMVGSLQQAIPWGGRGEPAASEPRQAVAPVLPFQQRMALAWDGFAGSIFLLLSDEDLVAKEFMEHAYRDAAWKNAMKHPRLVRHELPGADHTFSNARDRAKAEELTLRQGLHNSLPSG